MWTVAVYLGMAQASQESHLFPHTPELLFLHSQKVRNLGLATETPEFKNIPQWLQSQEAPVAVTTLTSRNVVIGQRDTESAQCLNDLDGQA